MLLGVPKMLDGSLPKILCDMGHGDELVIADANFPAERCGQRVVRSHAASGIEMLDAVLSVMPLDHLGAQPASLMAVEPDDGCPEPAIWEEYAERIPGNNFNDRFRMLSRGEFYERSEKAYAVIQTGEEALYANIILRKGVVR